MCGINYADDARDEGAGGGARTLERRAGTANCETRERGAGSGRSGDPHRSPPAVPANFAKSIRLKGVSPLFPLPAPVRPGPGAFMPSHISTMLPAHFKRDNSPIYFPPNLGDAPAAGRRRAAGAQQPFP